MITAFVIVMMLVIEYLNVITAGSWHEKLAQSRIGQYFIAALLGLVPGCLGSFMVVAMYTHRVVSIGALVTVMTIMTGDEAFLMIALIPSKFIALEAILVPIGIAAGILTDFILKKHSEKQAADCEGLQIHPHADSQLMPFTQILTQLKNCSLARGTLIISLAIFTGFVAAGQFEFTEWNWIRITVLLTMCVALFIVITVPDHFLEEHLWDHVVRKHAPRIFLWTLGAFLILHFMQVDRLNVREFITGNRWLMLLAAALVGIIPESGPHIVFITMFSEGLIPFSVLLANSIVQDGHGMIPLLAYSRKDFITVKIIKLAAALAVGYAMMAAGG
jgi:hypothetical protein